MRLGHYYHTAIEWWELARTWISASQKTRFKLPALQLSHSTEPL
jgi:hypothetical protein